MWTSFEATDERHEDAIYEAKFDIEFKASRGFAGSYFEPPEPPEVEIHSIDLVELTRDGVKVEFDEATAKSYVAWVEKEFDERLYEAMAEAAEEERYSYQD